MYIEFHARSAFSFLEGASLPEDLVSTCAQYQMPAMALLDRDGVYGSPRFYLSAKHIGLKAHIGAEVSCEAFSFQKEKNLSPQRHRGTEKTEKEKSAFNHDLENFLNACHPERSEALAEHSGGPAFLSRAPLPSTNLQSEITNLRSGDFRLPLLVSSRPGYQNLCRLITRMKLRAPRKEEGAVLENELEQYAPGL